MKSPKCDNILWCLTVENLCLVLELVLVKLKYLNYLKRQIKGYF